MVTPVAWTSFATGCTPPVHGIHDFYYVEAGDRTIRSNHSGRVRVPTGLALALPPGMEGQVRPRSGLAWRTGVTVLNAPGTIDADYRGEIQVLLVNLGSEPAVIKRGDRVAHGREIDHGRHAGEVLH